MVRILLAMIISLTFGILFYRGYLFYERELKLSAELTHKLSAKNLAYSTTIHSHKNQLMALLPGERRHRLNLEEVPAHTLHAFLAIEDSRFYHHRGVSLFSLLRALTTNLRHGGFIEGGSTITQQTVRRFFLSSEKKIKRKLKEMVLAITLEHHLSKEEILQLYLSEMYFGKRAYGLKSAAEIYFGHSDLKNLTLAQSAYLAALLKAPSRLGKHPALARKRARRVLRRMLTHGWISQEQYSKSLQERVQPTQKPLTRVREAPYYVDQVRYELARYFDEKTLHSGLHITTPYRSHWGQRLRKTLKAQYDYLKDLSLDPELFSQEVQRAGVILHAPTSEVWALEGGKDYQKSQFNRALFTKRPMGKTIIPFLGLVLLNKGKKLQDLLFASHSSLTYFDILQDEKLWHLAGEVRLFGYASLTNLLSYLGASSPHPKTDMGVLLGEHPITPINLATLYGHLLLYSQKQKNSFKGPTWVKKVTAPYHSTPLLSHLSSTTYSGSEKHLLGKKLIKEVFQRSDCTARITSLIGGDDYWSVFIRDSVVVVTWIGSERGRISLPSLSHKDQEHYKNLSQLSFSTPCRDKALTWALNSQKLPKSYP